jgi:hypothetical protein
MDVITLYSEILSAYSEKVGIYPLLTKAPEDRVSVSSVPETQPAVLKSRTLYTRVPEPTGRAIYTKPTRVESVALDEARDIILSRRRSRFTKEGITNISSDKITGHAHL